MLNANLKVRTTRARLPDHLDSSTPTRAGCQSTKPDHLDASRLPELTHFPASAVCARKNVGEHYTRQRLCLTDL